MLETINRLRMKELEQNVYEMPLFKKSYTLEDGVSFEMEVALDPDVIIPYINPSLYINGELAMHHTALHELKELVEGVLFDLSNGDNVFEVTSIGQAILRKEESASFFIWGCIKKRNYFDKIWHNV